MAIFLISLLVVTCLTIYVFTSKSEPKKVEKEIQPRTSVRTKPKIVVGNYNDDAKVEELRYFCIKDKGYHVSVWPKDQRLGDYLDFTIAGMNYVDNIEDYIGEFTGTLIADPSNPYDHNAIKVVARDGHRVGYVPKNMTAEVRSFTTLPCQCYCFIGFNNGTYFSCCYITNLPNVSPYQK